MKVLITGSNGFVGKNLLTTLKYIKDIELLTYNRQDDMALLEKHCMECDFVVHLAGVNRPQNIKDFYSVNVNLTANLLTKLKKHNNKAPILMSSSIQAESNNDYGKSKKAAEQLLINYGKTEGVNIFIYRLTNLFGKWAKPFYNSVVATWCHQISRGEEIEVSDPDHLMEFIYIDDLVSEIIAAINNKPYQLKENYYQVPTSYQITLGLLAKTLKSFKNSRNNFFIENMGDDLTKKLYSTYLNYLPVDDFSYPLVSHQDKRGSFTEVIKSKYAGQVSVNVSKAQETKGEHWHHSKNEKFLVVKGKALIQFREIFKEEIIEYVLSDEKFEIVDIPTGYTHNITNIGSGDLITIMWSNEPYNPEKADTYYEKVIKD